MVGSIQKSPSHSFLCTNLIYSIEKDTLLSFPCGHIFHLECLLTTVVPGTDAEGGIETLEDDVEGVLLNTETLASARSVGTKVTHAALLKEKLAATDGGGKCTICQRKKEEEVEDTGESA